MEHQPHHPEDRDRSIPEDERLWPGEIDLTGVVEQEESLRDVIGDAIGEAEESGSEVPDWGARTLARALANQLDDPQSGALHHFAVTGRADKESIGVELAAIYEGSADDEIKDWVNWLGTYVVNLPDEDTTSSAAGNQEQQPSTLEVPINGTPLEKVSAYLRIAFAEADARGEVISRDAAQAIATLLASLLPQDSEMHRFADIGDAHPALLHEECHRLKAHRWQTPDIGTWLTRFEQYLAAQTDLGRRASATEREDNAQVAEGTRVHGDAFRAYLSLPDVDPNREDLASSFRDTYVGTFDTWAALVRDLTEGVISQEERDRWARDGVSAEAVVREVFDIVEHHGKLYVFSK
ncbi:hypothetical protein L1857_08485 [Amycolatopsis thermalba]|uniref:Uncharacterized protein n=1 Tax=Amycolatopsis thermalba TaxID=944492 RepID=A0ABY4NS13_9PSEU|nr:MULTISPECIES: hypothetical protein [Amycolatopsis]UQS22850.1 hypothetical protein L1857_08485 [Amycolatopsis thermalba]